MRRHAPLLTCFVLIAVGFTWPLLPRAATAIASDPYDPLLNTTVLWWNAVTWPFSTAWWNSPWFHPTPGVASFTENLVGISTVASPIYWLTHNPLTAYNLALFVTWPASAIAAYLLTERLTQRRDAAFLAGLAYAFSPYRATELAHIQVLSSYWLPVALLGLHGYVESRRRAWLVLFGVAWLLQAWANGYFLLYGGVLVGLWLLWFASPRRHWPAIVPMAAVWFLASLPLAPVLYQYQQLHTRFGLRREAYEVAAFSASPASWAEASGRLFVWTGVLRDGDDNLFPGATVLLVVALGCVLALWSPVRDGATRRAHSLLHRLVGVVLAVALILSLSAAVAILVAGPWEVLLLGIPIKMADLNRALAVMTASTAALVWRSPRARAALAARDPLIFYVGATLVIALLCCGPVLLAAGRPILSPAPYRWLMALPGFTELRVPMRFWMLGVLCLSVAAGIVASRLPRTGRIARAATLALLCGGVLADGWLVAMPMAAVPHSYRLPPDVGVPVLELPLGPDYDAAATYRAIAHQRPVINGVSGYDPPHYAPLHAGLAARDPQVLMALASLGAYDIVIDRATDLDGTWRQYAAGVPGAVETSRDAERTVYRIPAVAAGEPALGAAWPIAGVAAFLHDARVAWDDALQTEWGDHPQRPGQWLVADLGRVRRVGGVSQALGRYSRDFPRLLRIDVSLDGQSWTTAWEGTTAAAAFLAGVRAPLASDMRFAFTARDARFVRLQQLATHPNMWRVAELRVHAPTGP